VQDAYIDLGWNESSWNGDIDPPATEETAWADLTAEEQAAAEFVCYEEGIWDELSLTEYGGDVDCGRRICFSSVDMVDVQGKGLVSMNSLKIGDYVLAGKEEYSRIYSFSHLDHGLKSKFLQIHAQGLEFPLEISKRHMLYVNDKMRPASQVKEGDMLDGNKKVSAIKEVERRGVYAPVTESGTIVVNGVLASTYVSLLDHSFVNMHTATHAVFAPHRMVCAFSFGICEKETYTDGYSNWIYTAMHFVNYINEFSAPVQSVATIAAAPVLGVLLLLEQLVLSPLFVPSLLSLGGFVYTKTRKGSMI
jgi:hypothetical protein